MSEPADPSREHEEIRSRLRGLLPDNQIERMIEMLRAQESVVARVEGSGAIAEGMGALAGGAGSVVVGGNVGGNIVLGSGTTGADPAALRSAYLSRLMEQVGDLSLTGIDPAAASNEAEARLSLEAVYTALLTMSPAEDQEGYRGFKGPDMGRRRSALEQLNLHERLVLLGDPGSGKSTFLNFVALCLAGEILGRPRANLALLRSPLSDEDEKPQPWSHGPLLPVRVVLRDFAARGLPSSEETASARHLWSFIEWTLEESSLDDYAPLLKKELQEKGGLLLFDGLDEVPEAESRRERIRQAVEDFGRTFGKCRVLLTSRTYAYRSQGWALKGFSEAVLAPFDNSQIGNFVQRWYDHAAAVGRIGAEEARGRAELLRRAIFGSNRLRGLAERPLLLTLMASLHAWRGGSLPERREQLYEDAVELLLNLWESQRVIRDAKGQTVLIQPSLAQHLAVGREQVRQVLEDLAFEIHCRGDLQGTADLPEGELVGRLMRLRRNPDTNPAELVDYLSQRAGLLVPRGIGVYTFPHRTFQEYLAACHLTGEEFPATVAELGRKDPGRWREVVLLAGAKAARGAISAVWTLAEHLCPREPDDPASGPEDAWGVHLAGQTIAESADLTKVGEVNRPKLERLQRWHVYLLGSDLFPAAERALAGTTLARLGDPRFDPNRFLLREPLLGFVEIPAGKFLMGSDPQRDPEAQKRETPQHEVDLPAYYISRFPVTAEQFRAFVKSSGFAAGPESLEGVSNHPMRGVSWHDALAYCEWLGDRLRELAREQPAAQPAERPFWEGLAAGRLRPALPSEAEWEKAARGTDGRIYPWGEKSGVEWANTDETGLGTTSTVGCFHQGVSPYGCEEMSGNVWEWTRSLGKDYPYTRDERKEDLQAPGPRVLRGGAYFSDSSYVRCAFRDWFGPPGRNWYVGFRVVLLPFSSDL